MSTQSQNTNLKKCNSCRRTLNYEFFGISKLTFDGFNSKCRPCRNQNRRISYGKSIEPYLLNLKRNNETYLEYFNESLYNDYILYAINLTNEEPLKVNIKINETTVSVHVSNKKEDSIIKFDILIQIEREQSLNSIKKFILQELLYRSIRLTKSEEEIFNILYL